jgi:C-terminal processing protease CtpA/Prc
MTLQLTPGHDLGDVRAMADFRADKPQGELTAAERDTLIQQAALLVEELYVHLPQKKAMYAIDPVQRLRLLRRRQADLTEPELHAELLGIFCQLRDLHTIYVLPAPFQKPFAFLGILLEQYWQDGVRHWIVSKVWNNLTGDPALVPGVEVTHWNGAPIALALARHAEQEGGGNPAARLARGLESMTLRSLAVSLPPDEDWVEVTYQAGGTVHETRIPWRIFDSAEDVKQFHGGSAPIAGAPVAGIPATHLMGLDLRTELVQRVKATLFAAAADDIHTTRPELKARTVTTSHGTYGHLRIFSFHMQPVLGDPVADIKAFIEDVRQALAQMPKDGLIVDVRGNGGGYVVAAEYLLQFLTARRIQPEPTQLVNTQATLDLASADDDFSRWVASIRESLLTSAQYSGAFPLSPEDLVNAEGQLYHGPVVLITDALCYSATDTFSAGFQDHGIGPVLGVDNATGAGGANVFEHSDLLDIWQDGPLKPLPGGARLRVALRRTLRVGEGHAGQIVEDFGVVPDALHALTKRDLVEDNPDLLEHASALLAGTTRYVLDVNDVMISRAGPTLTVTTEHLSGLDIYANGRPLTTAVVLDGINTVRLPLPSLNDVVLRIEGFDGATLAAARTVSPAAPPL